MPHGNCPGKVEQGAGDQRDRAGTIAAQNHRLNDAAHADRGEAVYVHRL
jgi:hypothetical protein